MPASIFTTLHRPQLGRRRAATRSPGLSLPRVVLNAAEHHQRSWQMKMTKALFAGATVVACALLWAACSARVSPGGTTIDRDDVAGVVTGASGPEAGVWVIAETSDLPTKFARIVVTDDQGRYLLPDLPQAKYDVWVRGYGLVDSPKQRAERGTTLNLTATSAPNPRAAAEYYPAGYWYSLLKVPPES